MDTKQALETIELLIDASTLSEFLENVAEVCNEKASHVSSNWQDKVLAREWEKAANSLDKLSAKVSV